MNNDATPDPLKDDDFFDVEYPPTVTPSECSTAMIIHLSTLVGYLIPLGNVIAPLIIWLLKKNDSDYIDFHGKEAINFQISLLIYYLISAVLVFVVIGIFLLFAIGIVALIFTIIAAVKANDGVTYRYPMCIRFIR